MHIKNLNCKLAQFQYTKIYTILFKKLRTKINHYYIKKNKNFSKAFLNAIKNAQKKNNLKFIFIIKTYNKIHMIKLSDIKNDQLNKFHSKNI